MLGSEDKRRNNELLNRECLERDGGTVKVKSSCSEPVLRVPDEVL
jgi:hypothetical protein